MYSFSLTIIFLALYNRVRIEYDAASDIIYMTRINIKSTLAFIFEKLRWRASPYMYFKYSTAKKENFCYTRDDCLPCYKGQNVLSYITSLEEPRLSLSSEANKQFRLKDSSVLLKWRYLNHKISYWHMNSWMRWFLEER